MKQRIEVRSQSATLVKPFEKICKILSLYEESDRNRIIKACEIILEKMPKRELKSKRDNSGRFIKVN